MPLLEFGTEEQKEKYLKPVASGEVIGAYALTEPQSGSDARAMRSRAVLSEDGSYYTINANKSWISSGPVAKFIVLFTQTEEADGSPAGISAFAIDTAKPGFRCGKHEPQAWDSRVVYLRDRAQWTISAQLKVVSANRVPDSRSR